MIKDTNGLIKTFKISSADSNSVSSTTVKVIREVFLKVFINGKQTASIACAGNYPDELALGFLKSENVIDSSNQIDKIEFDNEKTSVNVIVKNEKDFIVPDIKSIASSGARGSENAYSLLPLSDTNNFNIKTSVALKLMQELLGGSEIHTETHGTHCSALARQDQIIALREDIGRHNTIDMLGGYSILHNINLPETVILTTGRVSSEIIYKIWNLGIPVIISHSAPTAKAIELARQANITLIGYVRGGKINIYSHERRVVI